MACNHASETEQGALPMICNHYLGALRDLAGHSKPVLVSFWQRIQNFQSVMQDLLGCMGVETSTNECRFAMATELQ